MSCKIHIASTITLYGGIFENNMMEGEWKFYRETGQRWQVGHFKNGMKNGVWLRYDRDDQLAYQETFENNKIIKRKA